MIREAIILPERHVATWTCGEPATIWYFGESYALWIELGKKLSNGSELAPVGDVLNRWARELTEPLRNLDAAVEIDDPAAWGASGIGCRGRFETPVTSFACCLAAFLEAMQGGGRHVFVVGDEDLARVLYDAARERHWDVGWRERGTSPKPSWVGALLRIIQIVRDRMTAVRHYGRRRLRLKRLRRRYPIDAKRLRQTDTVMVLWGRANTFSAQDPQVRDGWFVDLPSLLQDAGRRMAYLIEPLDWADSYEAILDNALASGQPVLMIEDAYTIGDVLRAAIATLRRPARPLRLEVGGLDLTPALDAALGREVRRGAPTLAHLQSGVGPLFRRLGMKPRSVVHLYEGQPWERSMRLSVRHALPETRTIAVQHMPFPPLFLNSVPSNREISTNDLPDTLMVLGPNIADFFLRLGFPTGRLAVGGALRFSAVKKISGVAQRRDILCCTGIDWCESLELADKAAQAVARFPGLRLVVNFNPQAQATMKAAVRDFVLAKLPPETRTRIEFSDLGVRELMCSSGVVLYSDTNAAYEAFASGCELIFVARNHALDYDKLPPGWATHCRSVDEIGEALRRWLDRSIQADRDERLRRLEKYLADVDESEFLSHI